MHPKLGIVVVVVAALSIALTWRSAKPTTLSNAVSAEPSKLEVRSGAYTSPLTFVVKNQGDVAVEIIEVTATCGCTVIKAPRRKLNPQEAMTIEVRASPPDVGEKTSLLTVHTVPPQRLPLNVLVTLKGEKQPAPFVSYCPNSLSLNGPVFGEKVEGQFEVHTLEKTGTSPWLVEEQLSEPKLRIWFDEPPAEEPIDSETVRRIYKMKVAAVLPAESESPTDRHRHVIATLSKSSSPEKTIAIERRVDPLVKAAPSVLNLTVSNGTSSPVERTIVVIDDRKTRSGHLVRSHADHDWLTVKANKSDIQEDRSIHSFQVVLDPQKFSANPGEPVIRSAVTFFLDDDETTALRVPIFMRTE